MMIIVVSPSLNMLSGAQRVCLATIRNLRRTGCKIVLATLEETDWARGESVWRDGETRWGDISFVQIA